MRTLACLGLAGCFAPNVIPGQPCAPDGWCPAPLECQSDHVCHDRPVTTPMSYGYAFVTSTTVALGTLQSPAAADVFCQTAADLASLPGHYIAWVSSASRNVGDLLRSTSFGWVRPDGRLFANSIGDLNSGRIAYPLRIDEHKATVPDGTLVMTVTTATGQFPKGSADCFALSSLTKAGTGVVDGGTTQWTEHGFDLRCDQLAPLYCLSTDTPAPAPTDDHLPPRAFLSWTAPNGMNGRDFLDMGCRADAQDANFANAARFIAFVPTSSQSLLAQLKTGPWARPDGVTFLDTDLTVLAPLNVTSKLEYVDMPVWGGTTQLDRPATPSDNCGDWTGNSPNALLGRASRSSVVEMVNDTSDGCFVNHNVYCIDP